MVGSTAATATAVQCVLDRAVVNPDTIRKFTNLGLSIFAVLCGKNRGVFVDQQKDPGNTYSCLTLPPSFQSLVSDPTVSMSTSNDIGTLAEFELNLEQRGFEQCNFIPHSCCNHSNWLSFSQTCSSKRGTLLVKKRLLCYKQ